MAVTVITRFIAKTTVLVIAYVHDKAGTLADPTTSIKVTIQDSDGDTQVDAEDMDKDGEVTGTYEYYGSTETSSAKGQWLGEVTVVDGEGDGAKTSTCNFSFEVVAGL